MEKKKQWTESEIDLLKREYPDHANRDIAQRLGRSKASVLQKAMRLRIVKSAELMLDGKFKKGQTPWNKGLKGLYIGGKETQFKPGEIRGRAKQRLKPVGAERISKDGIIQRKVRLDGPAHRRWQSVHSILWEETHGMIPSGHIVIFIDCDRTNIEPDNLALVSRAELMEMNNIGWNDLPAQLRPTAITAIRLKVMARKKEK